MLPLFYFPTTFVAIDDDQTCLDALQSIFKSKCILKTFQSPDEAVVFLNNYYSPLSKFIFFSPLEDQSNDLDEHFHVDFNLTTLTPFSTFCTN